MQNTFILSGFTALLFFAFSTTGFSQSIFSFGLKGGLGSSSILIDDQKLADEIELVSLTRNTHFSQISTHIGGYGNLRYELGGLDFLFVQPEVYMTFNAGGTMRLIMQDDNQQEQKVNINEKFNRLDIPLLLGYWIIGIRLGAGPVFSSILSSETDWDNYDNFKQTFKSGSVGFQVGIGIDKKNVQFDLRYENIGGFEDRFSLGGQAFETNSRISQFLFSLAYKLK
ncbi:MAG: outer membrane beta-barrel protein [Flammeovirgaceae bacterium]|nr:outer membrane beta-barrel protein [Flammeovirgaceae bacterium]